MIKRIAIIVCMSVWMTGITKADQVFSSYFNFAGGAAAPLGCIKTLDGGFAVFGVDPGHWMVKFDAANNIQWSQSYGGGNGGAVITLFLIQLPDSSYIFNWNGPDTPLGGYCSGTNFDRLDKNGNLLFTMRDQSSSGSALVFTTDAKLIPGTDSIIFVESYNGNDRSYITKMASNGNSVNVRATFAGSGYAFYSINPLMNGGILQGYIATDQTSGLTKMDVSGNVIWTKKYSYSFEKVLQVGNYYYATGGGNITKLDLNGNPLTAVLLPENITCMEVSNHNTLNLVLSTYQSYYKILEMDTNLSIIRAKASNGNIAYFGDIRSLIDPSTGAFYLLGLNNNLIGLEKASLDSSCSFHDTTLTTVLVTVTTSAQSGSSVTSHILGSYTDTQAAFAVTDSNACTINYTPPVAKTNFKAFIPNNRLSATIATKDGGSISVGSDGSNNDCMLMKVDNHGNVLWSKSYYSNLAYGPVLKSFVVELPDSSLYLGVNGPIDQGQIGNNTRYIFYRLSSNGNVLYSYQSDIHGGDFSGIFLSDMKIIPNTDTLVYVTRFYSDLNNFYSSSLCKMGPDGVEIIISQKDQTSFNGYVFYTVTPVTTAGVADGFIVTTASTSGAPNQTGLMKINNNGTVAWQMQLSGASVISGVTQLGNEYYAVGTGFSAGNYIGYFYKISSAGSLLLSTSNPVSTNNTAIYEEQNSFSAIGNRLVNAYSYKGKPMAIEFDQSGNITRAKTAGYSGDFTSSGIDVVNEDLYFASIPGSATDLTFEKMNFNNSCSFYDTTISATPYTATVGSFTLPLNSVNTEQFTVGPPATINLGLTSIVNCLDTNGCTVPVAVITAGGATTFCPADSVSLSALTGTGYTYQWQLNGADISGQTNSTYVAHTAGNYTCKVTNSCNSHQSNSIIITISNTPIAAITAGGPTSFCTGSNVLLSANPANGYQWKLNGGNISGATSQTYTAIATGSYTCSVTQSCGTATSNSISVNVIIPPTASITAGGATTFCSGLNVVLSAATATGYTYKWQLNGTNITSATASNYSATAAGNYTCVVTNSCGTSTSNTISVTILPLPATPVITPAGSSAVCSGQSITFTTPLVSGYTYQWKRNGTVLGTTTNTLTTATAGTYTVIVNNGTCPSSPSAASVLTVNAQPTATITASTPTTVCAGGGVVLNANTGTGLTYQWQKASVNIAGATAASYTATTVGSYRVIVTNANGCTKNSNAISAVFTGSSVTAAITVTGPTTFCIGAGTFLKETTSIPGYSYQWNLNGVAISGATTNSYTPVASGNYTVVVTAACGSATSAIQSITVNPAPTVSITAPNGTVLCPAPTLELDATGTNIVSYQWQLNGSNISGATAAIYNAPAAGNYTCVVTNTCGTATSNVITLTGGGTAPVAIITANGPTTFCDTDSLLLSAQTGTGYSYQWQLNGSNVGGANNSDYLVFASGNYTCLVTTTCGSATSNIITTTVNITPAQPGTVTSISQACNPVNNVPVSISALPGATSYHWYAINPTITFNGPVDGLTASANLLPSTNSGYNIWVEAINNGCVSQPRIKYIRRTLSVPASVIGSAQVCVPQTGVNYSCASIVGADDYLWTVPTGVTITSGQGTNAIVVSFTSNYTTGSICVSARLNCGFATTPKCKTVSSFGNSNITITNLSGPTYLCPGSTYNYSVNNISGATFNWSVPANTSITSGQGTNAITISVASGFSSGSVCVNATNGCATSLSKCTGVATSTPGRPNSISGILNGVCASTHSYTSSTVAGATSYLWSVTGGSILSGQNTQTISVQWNGSGTTGALNVAAVNGCGSGLVRSVGTTLKPDVASAISGPSTVCGGSTNNVFTIPATTGASTYVWQLVPASSTIVSGQNSTSINATWGASSGTVYCTPYNACGSSKTKSHTVTVNCRLGDNAAAVNDLHSMEIIAYPNPFNDKINIELNSNDDATVEIKVADVAGRIISEQMINANSVYTLGENMSSGIYFVTAKQNDTVKTIRIVKNQ